MTYRKITSKQRYTLAALRTQGLNQSEIPCSFGCDPATENGHARRGPITASAQKPFCNKYVSLPFTVGLVQQPDKVVARFTRTTYLVR